MESFTIKLEVIYGEIFFNVRVRPLSEIEKSGSSQNNKLMRSKESSDHAALMKYSNIQIYANDVLIYS